jgi:hypothetical protein
MGGGDCLRRPAIAFLYWKGRERKETKRAKERVERESEERGKERRRNNVPGINALAVNVIIKTSAKKERLPGYFI